MAPLIFIIAISAVVAGVGYFFTDTRDEKNDQNFEQQESSRLKDLKSEKKKLEDHLNALTFESSKYGDYLFQKYQIYNHDSKPAIKRVIYDGRGIIIYTMGYRLDGTPIEGSKGNMSFYVNEGILYYLINGKTLFDLKGEQESFKKTLADTESKIEDTKKSIEKLSQDALSLKDFEDVNVIYDKTNYIYKKRKRKLTNTVAGKNIKQANLVGKEVQKSSRRIINDDFDYSGIEYIRSIINTYLDKAKKTKAWYLSLGGNSDELHFYNFNKIEDSDFQAMISLLTGFAGEEKIKSQLMMGKYGELLWNVLLQKGEGENSTQIDAIYITTKGIFNIEVKTRRVPNDYPIVVLYKHNLTFKNRNGEIKYFQTNDQFTLDSQIALHEGAIKEAIHTKYHQYIHSYVIIVNTNSETDFGIDRASFERDRFSAIKIDEINSEIQRYRFNAEPNTPNKDLTEEEINEIKSDLIKRVDFCEDPQISVNQAEEKKYDHCNNLLFYNDRDQFTFSEFQSRESIEKVVQKLKIFDHLQQKNNVLNSKKTKEKNLQFLKASYEENAKEYNESLKAERDFSTLPRHNINEYFEKSHPTFDDELPF